MQTINIPVTITGSNGKKITIPYVKVGVVDGQAEMIMNSMLVAMAENLCAKQEESYKDKPWLPGQAERFALNPDTHVTFHGVTLDAWRPANKDALAALKIFMAEQSVPV